MLQGAREGVRAPGLPREPGRHAACPVRHTVRCAQDTPGCWHAVRQAACDSCPYCTAQREACVVRSAWAGCHTAARQPGQSAAACGGRHALPAPPHPAAQHLRTADLLTSFVHNRHAGRDPAQSDRKAQRVDAVRGAGHFRRVRGLHWARLCAAPGAQRQALGSNWPHACWRSNRNCCRSAQLVRRPPTLSFLRLLCDMSQTCRVEACTAELHHSASRCVCSHRCRTERCTR
jgi:hypothetical protein